MADTMKPLTFEQAKELHGDVLQYFRSPETDKWIEWFKERGLDIVEITCHYYNGETKDLERVNYNPERAVLLIGYKEIDRLIARDDHEMDL